MVVAAALLLLFFVVAVAPTASQLVDTAWWRGDASALDNTFQFVSCGRSVDCLTCTPHNKATDHCAVKRSVYSRTDGQPNEAEEDEQKRANMHSPSIAYDVHTDKLSHTMQDAYERVHTCATPSLHFNRNCVKYVTLHGPTHIHNDVRCSAYTIYHTKRISAAFMCGSVPI